MEAGFSQMQSDTHIYKNYSICTVLSILNPGSYIYMQGTEYMPSSGAK